ncbi:hypothetical protein AN958_05847 [Leucoagaricus sp. SymC.cos]|nr:hypothetical protein AN958_05847 [Leucoagaricus sp. SymC.cos]
MPSTVGSFTICIERKELEGLRPMKWRSRPGSLASMYDDGANDHVFRLANNAIRLFSPNLLCDHCSRYTGSERGS